MKTRRRRHSLFASLALAAVVASCGANAPQGDLTSLFASLARDRSAFTATERLEFAAALSRRLEVLGEIRERLTQAPGVGDQPLKRAGELEDEIAHELLELRQTDEDWRAAREHLLADARRLQESLGELATSSEPPANG